jgi:hypothetical protein
MAGNTSRPRPVVVSRLVTCRGWHRERVEPLPSLRQWQTRLSFVVSVLFDVVPPSFVGVLAGVARTVAPGNPGPPGWTSRRFSDLNSNEMFSEKSRIRSSTMTHSCVSVRNWVALLHEEVHHRVPFAPVVVLAQNPRSNRQLWLEIRREIL